MPKPSPARLIASFNTLADSCPIYTISLDGIPLFDARLVEDAHGMANPELQCNRLTFAERDFRTQQRFPELQQA